MKLLKGLLDDHMAIAGMLEKVVEPGTVTDEALAAFRLVRALMLSHLKKENEEFYPVLRKAAGTLRPSTPWHSGSLTHILREGTERNSVRSRNPGRSW
ncbi:MAG: hypothetical protein OEW15_04460 [Nitrospirota bacterium]|nr:hypothetical protein [Nitrospirota bacterium]